MARIRTVKPSFFRHERLQELELDNPGCYVMIVFMGLWTLCDSKGRFEYKPRQIKLDVLPFLEFDMGNTLDILVNNGFILCYESQKNTYGKIPTFVEHQRITGKEATDGERYPDPTETHNSLEGNTWETPEQQQGEQERGKEEERGKDITPVPQVQKEKQFIQLFNEITKRKFESLDSKAKGQFKARLQEGHNSLHFKKAITIALIEMTERGTDKYLTPEFITRPSEFSKYYNMELKPQLNNNTVIDHKTQLA